MVLIKALKPLTSGCLQRAVCLNPHILPGAAGPSGSEPAGGACVGGCGGGGSFPPSRHCPALHNVSPSASAHGACPRVRRHRARCCGERAQGWVVLG